MDQHQSCPVPQGPGHGMRTSAEAVATGMFDADRYRHHLAQLELTPEQQNDLLEVVWQMMRSFVDRAFGDDAVQLARIPGDDGVAARELGAPVALDSTSSHQENSNSDLASTFAKVGRGD